MALVLDSIVRQIRLKSNGRLLLMHGVDLLLLTNSHLVLLGKGCLSFLDLIGFLEVFYFFLS
jgi:hypothetical protein